MAARHAIIQGTKHSIRVEVGTWDPERWTDKETGKPFGGFAFGMTAEIFVSPSIFDDRQKAEVSMGSIGSHSPEVALNRAETYVAAAKIADALNTFFDTTGKGIEDAAAAILYDVRAFVPDEVDVVNVQALRTE